jgi:hypothetical protein
LITTTEPVTTRSFWVLFYRAAVDLSRSTLNYVAGIVRRHRKAIGSAWRLLTPGQQALLVLVHLRKGETFAEAGAGFGVSTSTAWRYVEEVVALRADRPYYSGKRRAHGMNVQVIATPGGTILWTSGALPGSTHDLTAARIWGILRELEQAGILTLADKGYQGAATAMVITPYKGRNKPESQKQGEPVTRQAPRTRRTRERANAQIKTWRLLRKLRCSPSKAGHLVKAIAVLQNYEITRG